MKLNFVVLLVFLSSFMAAQNNCASKKVYSGTCGTNTLTVFKRESSIEPYQIRVSDKKDQIRQFFVMKFASDVFNYLMVERKGAELTYYPLVWSDLDAITLKEVTERSKEIIAGKVPSVSKSSL